MPAPFLGRIRRPARTSAAVVAAVAATATLTLTGPAIARSVAHAVNPPPTVPTSDSQIQNIDQVKTAIKGYYQDTTTAQLDPVAGTAALHQFSSTSNYAKQVRGIAKDAKAFLDNPPDGSTPGPGAKAILLDVDDTTLNTYSYEIYSGFVYNPTTNAAFVNACLGATGCVFPAVPGMVSLVNNAENHGYAVFYLTGRPVSQFNGTLLNLRQEGYAVDPSHLYLKDTTAPWLAGCGGAACTTTQYKSATRQHIESLGYNIVANFGDQFSDLNGGFADRTYKIPNPMYYLP